MTYRKKLIEVALPLDAINKASTRENYIYKGNPSAIHKWWAQRPLAACRAVLFASLVDDPSEHPEEFPTEQDQERERDRLFNLIVALVQWENPNNEEVMAKVRAEIFKSTADNLPPLLDPFAGGGSIPLEAQRLGLEVHASDLNPVAVLINKALVEIPPKFAGHPPVNPDAKKLLIGRDWHGAQGLAEDIRYYGKWMTAEAERRIGYLYPKVELPKDHGGGEATVIAWLWARTVKCPNPACGTQMPLVRSFWLSTKKGKETWVEPIIERGTTPPIIQFTVKAGSGKPQSSTKVGHGSQFKCICCDSVVSDQYIKTEGLAKRMGKQLMAIAAETKQARIYLRPTSKHEDIATQAIPEWKPDQELAGDRRAIYCPLYGLNTFGDLFTPRQLVSLNVFTNLIGEVHKQVRADSIAAGMPTDEASLNDGGTGVAAYADALATYLAFACDKYAMYGCALVPWYTKEDRPTMLFANQVISMVWDFAEINPFTDIGGSITRSVSIIADSVAAISNNAPGFATQRDATTVSFSNPVIISTDPPYYDNIGYADLSDFFYVWLRRSLGQIFPDLFSTLLVPKSHELVALPYRFGGNKDEAQHFFETGLKDAFMHMRAIHHMDYPLTVYYAFKQSETDQNVDEDGKETSVIASTGWETMLEGLIQAGFAITGTWPMRTERSGRLRDTGSNALASSIVLVCRPRPVDTPIASRRQFLNALRAELPLALKNLQRGSIAPVDLAQASIGPGMAIYSRYSKVVESDGTPLRVRTALQLINRALDEALAEQEGEYDAETRWAIAWFEEYAMNAGEYGRAETLSKAKNTAVQTLEHAGLVVSKAGKVRLVKREELSSNWNPKTSRLTVWEVMQRMIFALLSGNGEIGAGDILRSASSQGEVARDLAYRLFVACERKGWTQEALAYNSLVTSWLEISRLAHRQAESVQQATFLE